jgi:alpha-ketoglutarate-dependent taurine dioxygenase
MPQCFPRRFVGAWLLAPTPRLTAKRRAHTTTGKAVYARRKEFVSTVYETEHPAVQVHPETSERSLVLGGFARTVAGFPP